MGTTAQKLQKLIQTKQKLVDNVNTMCGTNYNINSKLEDIVNSILDIQTGIDTADATASAGDILLGKTAYVNGQKIVGTIEKYDYSFNVRTEEEEGLTEEEINALQNMQTELTDELTINYDDEVLDVSFELQGNDLVVDNNMEEAEYSINNNKELEVDY